MSNQASCFFFLTGIIRIISVRLKQTVKSMHFVERIPLLADSQLVVAHFYCDIYSIGEENVIPLHYAS